MVPADYMSYALKRESGGNLFAKNPRSSATGPFQFTDATWADVARKNPHLGLTPDGRTDANQSKLAMDAFTAENSGILERNGHPINKNTLYTMHRFGAGDGPKILSADPSTPLENVFGPRSAQIMKANPDLMGKTVGDITGGTPTSMPQEIVPFQRRPMSGNVAPDDSGALSAENVAGPGALFNQNALDGITKAGVYLSGISNPASLSALGSIGPKPGRYSVQRDERTGAIFTIDNQTGRSVRTQDPSWSGEKVDAGTLKTLGEDNKGYGQLQGVTERAKYFQDKIQSGELKLDVAAKGKAMWESLNGATSPQSQLYNEFDAFKTELANSHLLVAKGTQTEGDAQRARQEFTAGLASLDKNTTVKQLDNIISKHGRVIADGKMQIDSLSAGINNPKVFAPYLERFQNYDKFYKDHEGSISRRAAPAATVPATGAGERRPLGDIFKK